MAEKVFVTGAGIISALGVGLEATARALLEEKSGIGKINHIATELNNYPVGEVALSNAEMSQMLNVGYPIENLRTVLMGIIAAKEAITTAHLTTQMLSKSAFISGTTVGGMDCTEKYFKSAYDSDGESAAVDELKYNDCGCSTQLIANSIGDFAMMTTTSTACSSAANAIVLGANMIKAGLVDIAVVGGSEALSKFHLNGFNTLMILDGERCRPFDKDRAGINLGEGAAYLVIESESSAKARGAEILGELSGYANTCDAYHQTASSDNGDGAYLSMTKALAMAGLQPDEIDYVNAHGTGTPNNDITELAAMRRVFGDKLPKFSSTKAFTGHTTSASGSIESVICLLAINRGFIPVNLGFKNEIDNDAKPVDKTIIAEVDHVVDNAFGFGGNDTTLIFSKHKG
jgi:3-oxoacyl-[acyl-carrier-protein] synthase-1